MAEVRSDIDARVMIRQILLERLRTITALLGSAALETNPSEAKRGESVRVLARQELKAIAERLDGVLFDLTGVSPRDLALVRLERALEEFASKVQGDPSVRGAKVGFSFMAVAEFSMAVCKQFPQCPEPMINFESLGPCLMAFVRSLRHSGPPPRGGRPIPVKWDAFHDLAVSLGIISAKTKAESIRRQVLEAKNKLVAVGLKG